MPFAVMLLRLEVGIWPSYRLKSLMNLRLLVFPSEMVDLKKFGGTIDSAEIPAMRTGDEMDMAGAILFQASRAGAYCNGNILVLDGGRLGITPSSY